MIKNFGIKNPDNRPKETEKVDAKNRALLLAPKTFRDEAYVPEVTVVLEVAVVAVGEATADDEANGAVVAARVVGC